MLSNALGLPPSTVPSRPAFTAVGEAVMRKRASSTSRGHAVDFDWLLSDGDLILLTGYRLPAAQRRWLDRAGLRYLTDAAGRPRVAREAVDVLLGVAKPSAQDLRDVPAKRVAPNFEALVKPASSATVARRARLGGAHGS